MENNNALIPAVSMVVAVDRPKVRELTTPEVYNPLVVLIAHLYLLRGQQVESGDLRFQAGELEQELRSSYPWLSLEEVRIALDNGVKKKYGEYYGLNVITYLDWIKAYAESEARRKAKEEAELAKLPPPHVPTPEEIEENTRKGILALQSLWESESFFMWCPDPADDYAYLLAKGLINPTKEDKARAMDLARQKLADSKIEEAKRDRRNGKRGPDTISNIINKYKEGYIPDKDDEKAVIRYAKAFLLFEYFKTLKDGNKDLKTILYA